MKKEVDICDICTKEITTGFCDVCKKSICKHHTKNWNVSLGSGYLAKIKLCSDCEGKIKYSKGMEGNEILKNMLLEFIKKQMVVDGLKDDE